VFFAVFLAANIYCMQNEYNKAEELYLAVEKYGACASQKFIYAISKSLNKNLILLYEKMGNIEKANIYRTKE